MSDRDLEARVATLEAALAELRIALERAQLGRRSMHQSARCPSCGSGHLLHFRHVQEVGHNNALVDVSLHKTRSFWGVVTASGAIDAFVCRACRLVEWHAISLKDVQPDGVDVVALEPDPDAPDGTPYR